MLLFEPFFDTNLISGLCLFGIIVSIFASTTTKLYLYRNFKGLPLHLDSQKE